MATVTDIKDDDHCNGGATTMTITAALELIAARMAPKERPHDAQDD